MTDALARVDIDPRAGGPVTVTVTGEIDLTNAAYLERRIDEATGLARQLVLDLTGLRYLDSQGVRVLHHLVERHVQGLVDVTVVAHAGSIAADLLAITRLDETVRVVGEPPTASAV